MSIYAGLPFNKSSIKPGLTDIGEVLALTNCKQRNNYRDYATCILHVEEIYDEIRAGESAIDLFYDS